MHSAVQKLFSEIRSSKHTISGVMDQAGLSHATADRWKQHSPVLDNLEAALNVVGYTLVPVPIGRNQTELAAQQRIEEAMRILTGAPK